MEQRQQQQGSPRKPQPKVKKKKTKPSPKLNPGWKPGRTKRRQALAVTMIQKCFRCFLLRRAFRESRVDTRATFAALKAFHRARDRKVWRGVDLRAMSREELRLAALALNIPSTGKKVLLICRLQRWVDQQLLASDLAAEAAARAAELHAKGQGAVYVCDATPAAAAIDLLPLRGKNISTIVAGHDSDAVYAIDRGAGALWLCKTGGMSGQVGLCRDPTKRGSSNRSNNSNEPEGSSEFEPPSESRWLTAPVFVHTLRAQHIVSAAISQAHGVALSAAGEIFSWGDNAHGELGVAVTSAAEVARNRATVVTTLANYRAVAASAAGQHSVAVCDRVAGHDGVVFTWGSNSCGQLGVGFVSEGFIAPTPPSSSPFPRPLVLHQVSTLRSLRIRQVACGSLHSLALSDDGHVYAWGCNDGGRLGLGSAGLSPKGKGPAASNSRQQVQTTPTRVGGALSTLVVLSIACGAWHSACVAASPADTAQFGAGRAFTWGTGIYGQLGVGEHKVLYEPHTVRLWDGDDGKTLENNNDHDEDDEDEPLVTMIACGMHHTAVVTAQNRVFVWGSHKTFTSTPRPLRLSSGGKGNNRDDGRDEVFGKIASLACGRTFTIFNTERRTPESFEPPPPSPIRVTDMNADARRLRTKLVGSIPRLDLSKVAPLPLMSSVPTIPQQSKKDSEIYRRLEPSVDQLQRQLDEKQHAARIEAIDIDAIVHPLCRVCWACDGFQPSPLRLWTCRRCCHDKQLHGTRKLGAPLSEFEAVRKLQTLYRARKARQLMQCARERHYQRVFSIKHSAFFYYNLWRRETTWERPLALSSITNEDDIPIRDPDELPVIQPPLTRDEAACVLQSHVRGWRTRVFVQRLLSNMYEKHIDLSKSDQEVYYIKVHEPDGKLCMTPIAQRRWDPPTPPPPLLRRLYSLGEPVENIRRRERANWTRDDAARALQQQFRLYRARKLVLKMARSRFRKMFDENSGQFYYYNVVTKESSWQTPRVLKLLLGEHEDATPAGRSSNKPLTRVQQRRGGIRIRREKFSDEVAAATTIQALYRRFASRKLVWERACHRYSKMVDPASGKCYYYDRVTGTSSWMKPAILGAGDLKISGASAGADRSASAREVSASPLAKMITIPSPAVPLIGEKARQKRRKRRLQRLQQMTPDQAAGLLQRAWRVNRARHELRTLLLDAYEKIYDPVTENYYFYNTKTGVVRWEKPSVLQFGNVEIKERVGGGKRHRRKRRRIDTVTDQGEAAAIVRTFMRCSHARLLLHTQLHARIQKLWDPESKRFYYFDALTGQSSWKKPLTLGDHDLPCVNRVT